MAFLLITERTELARKTLFSKANAVVVAFTYEELRQKEATEQTNLFCRPWALIVVEVGTEQAADLLARSVWVHLLAGKQVLYLRKAGVSDDLAVKALCGGYRTIYTALDKEDLYGAALHNFFWRNVEQRSLDQILQGMFEAKMALTEYSASTKVQTEPAKVEEFYSVTGKTKNFIIVHNDLASPICASGCATQLIPNSAISVETYEPFYTICDEQTEGVPRKYALYMMKGEYYTTKVPKPVLEDSAPTGPVAAKSIPTAPAEVPKTIDVKDCKPVQIRFCVKNQTKHEVGVYLGSSATVFLGRNTVMEGLQSHPLFWFHVDEPTKQFPLTDDTIADVYYWVSTK